MEFRELKYFLAVAREENITKAAELVNTTQPNLSRQMQRLEREIGQPLFIRASRKISLTETGLMLRRRAEEIIGLYEKTESELAAPLGQIAGDVYVGGGESQVMKYVVRAAQRTQNFYPGIRFHMFSGDAGIIVERLGSGLLDFGVLFDYGDMSKYDFLRLPLTDRWGVLMRKDSPLAEKTSISAADLKSLPLIFSQQAMANKEHAITNWFAQNNIAPQVAGTYNLLFNASIMVEEGMGYALGLDKIINTGGNSELCFRPLAPRVESYLDIAWKKYTVLPRAAELFLEQLRTTL